MDSFFFNMGPQEMFMLFLIPIFFLILLLLIPYIFYIVFLQSTLNSISYENRRMPPGNVWLLLIPVFGTIWHFVVVRNIADSIRDEANSKGMLLREDRPAYTIGMVMCILNCAAFVPGVIALAGPASLVCWIIYWVKVADYKSELRRYSFVSN